MTPARPLAASVAALGIAGVVGVPVPATAAPAPCERAERYAAQSGAELLRLNRLTLTAGGAGTSPAKASTPAPPPADRPGRNGKHTATDQAPEPAAASAATDQAAPPAGTEPAAPPAATGDVQAGPATDTVPPAGGTVRDVRIGEAKSALVAEAAPNSAAVTRMLNSSDGSPLSEPLLQKAPPANAEPARRDTSAAEAGPLLLGGGRLTGHARWLPGMACGTTTGEVTRATATLRAAQVRGVGDDVLVAVPDRWESVSTTALERSSVGVRTVATATVGARTFKLLDGAITVKVVRPPMLRTRMSTMDGGEVVYVPAVLEVSGDGIEGAELDTAGDSVDLTIRAGGASRRESRSLPTMDLSGGSPLTLPTIPGVAPLSDPKPEAAPVPGPGTHVRIALGDVRQATLGHSVAARVAAVKIAISAGGPESRQGYDAATGTLLDLELGLLESAAVAPEPTGGGVSGGVSGAGAGGGLPLTGPRVDLLAVGGVALVGLGAAAMVFGLRRRRFRA
jgi:hypothetical protein